LAPCRDAPTPPSMSMRHRFTMLCRDPAFRILCPPTRGCCARWARGTSALFPSRIIASHSSLLLL
jgi:hypothetical protein